jgi:hypothetical protein
MKYPALPSSVMAPGGPVTVEIVPKCVDDDGGHCWGLWRQADRKIVVERNAYPRHMWVTLYHEMVHVALDDAGLSNMLTEAQQEGIADAIATARVRERFG